ncbi:DUF4038 domain-containing protein [Microbacterium immunditiarum]|uniref:Apiosidase-like catalytic domain-containing protein n=1 Tax=Microbacterium immunditiarum TaxID=337480 RepID=A0A7Y9KIQ9_9MICO|nr:DUF4038 domain-containing protein [Microbacterium immunditiarum]NYE19015.1 hypothetical protein [Microbacterium immunditiarum]
MSHSHTPPGSPLGGGLRVGGSGRHLVDREGLFVPLIIDTAWSAFSDTTEDEWRVYLATRRRQGFTAVLVATTPILHDRMTRPDSLESYERRADGFPDFDRPRAEFWQRARDFTRIAHGEFGITLLVTVLWNNYLPGTWGAAATPGVVMPDGVRRDFVRAVADALADLEPAFVVGGDDHYDVPDANAGYLEAIELLRERAPSSLLTTHTAPRAVLPAQIAERLDFFLHQSGHNVENVDLTWQQPAQYLALSPRKPLVNSEPPYELHGKVGGRARRSRAEVRAASWASVLSGSSAGIGYGAHGVWMWATTHGSFEAGDSSLDPFLWADALRLPGALDISLLARLFRDHRLDRLDPAQELLGPGLDPVLRAAADPQRDIVAVHLPYASAVTIDHDLSGHDIRMWDLHERTPIVPVVRHSSGRTIIEQAFGEADQLIIAEHGR